MKPPEGFVSVETPRGEVWVRPAAVDWAREALDREETLHAWAGERDGARALQGRGRVWDVPAPVHGPDQRDRWAVRHFRRGGAVAGPLLDDRYLAGPAEARPFHELRASEALRGRGIPTPAVVAAAVYPAGLFYRGDLVTELVPGGVDLRDLLFGEDRNPDAAGPDPEAALVAVGKLIRRMERLGVHHPDLNAANVLLTGTDAGEAWLLDLDQCQVRPEGTPAPAGPMRDRLRRSLAKLAGKAETDVPDAWLGALGRGLEEGGR